MQFTKIAKIINYRCGCMCEFIIKDGFGRNKEWRVLACNLHCKNTAQVQQKAMEDYLTMLNDTISEHDAIQLLTEKGYVVKTQENVNGIQH